MAKPKPKPKKTVPKRPPPMKTPMRSAARVNGSSESEGSVPKTHNVGARKEIILKTIKAIARLEKERDAITADIAQLKQTNIKGDLGMKIADFNTALRLYQLEDADRGEFFDTLRETFEAIGVGGQLDFINAMEKTKPPAGAEPSVHDPEQGQA